VQVRVLKVNCVNTLAAMRTLNVCMQAGAGKAERWQSLTVVRTNYQAKTLEKIGVRKKLVSANNTAKLSHWQGRATGLSCWDLCSEYLHAISGQWMLRRVSQTNPKGHNLSAPN